MNSHHFHWFSHGFPIIYPGFSYDFPWLPMISAKSSHHLPILQGKQQAAPGTSSLAEWRTSFSELPKGRTPGRVFHEVSSKCPTWRFVNHLHGPCYIMLYHVSMLSPDSSSWAISAWCFPSTTNKLHTFPSRFQLQIWMDFDLKNAPAWIEC